MQTTTLPDLTDAAFAAATAPGTGFVAVDFTAEWCPPCRVMAPILETVAAEFADRLRVFQMNTDANPATMVRLGVRSMPTILIFRDGEIVDRIVGIMAAAKLRERFDRLGQTAP